MSEDELYGAQGQQSVIERGMDSLERSRAIEQEAMTEIGKLRGKRSANLEILRIINH